MRKSLGVLFLAVWMAVHLSGCAQVIGAVTLGTIGAVMDDRTDKDRIMNFVSDHEADLMAAIAEDDFSSFENRGFIGEINADERCVDFFCGGAGLGSATSYVGFFYAPDGNKCAVWCASVSETSLTPSGSGYSWQQKEGDNAYYVEPICGNFFYYEASF